MTEQVRDTLVINGSTFPVSPSPLAAYFEQHPERRPAFEPPDSSVWRGYVAEWVIEDGLLQLAGLSGWLADDSGLLDEVGLNAVFPGGSEGREKLAATWFSGELRAGRSHLILIEAGRVVSDTKLPDDDQPVQPVRSPRLLPKGVFRL